MKTEISNFFVLVVIFSFGWFLVFCFLSENRKQKISQNFKSDQKMTTNTRKSAKKHPESHLGLFSDGLTLSWEKARRFLPVSACKHNNSATLAVSFFTCALPQLAPKLTNRGKESRCTPEEGQRARTEDHAPQRDKQFRREPVGRACLGLQGTTRTWLHILLRMACFL